MKEGYFNSLNVLEEGLKLDTVRCKVTISKGIFL